MKKRALSIIGLALAASSLTACGGIPTDASEDEFCKGFENVGEGAGDPTEEDFDFKKYIESVQEDVEEIRETGTPEKISDDAREGFDISTQAILDLDSDTSQEDFEEFEEEFDKDEKKKSEAFEEYLAETCSL